MPRSRWLTIVVGRLTLLLIAAQPGSDLPPALTSPVFAAPMLLNYGGFLSIAGTSFVSAVSDNSYQYVSWGGLRLTASPATWPFFHASVELPDGATITAVTLYYQDNDSDLDDYINLYLRRYNSAGDYDDMAWATTSGLSGTGSTSDTTITDAVVDNSSYVYELAAGMPISNDVVLYGAKITYTEPGVTALDSTPPVPSVPPLTQDKQMTPLADPATVDSLEADSQAPTAHALHTGGHTILLAASPAGLDASGDKTSGDRGSAASVTTPLGPLADGDPFGWRYHSVAGSNFHPAYSDTTHFWASGGGRYVASAPTLASLVAPLDLVHGKTIQQVRFTFYDNSAENSTLYLYQVSRQGGPGSGIIWSYTPDVTGGYLQAVSPYLGQVIDNQTYAYYFVAQLGETPAGVNLQALEVEIAYVIPVYLPLILKNT